MRRRRSAALALLCLLAASCTGPATDQPGAAGCFERHLLEAIELNLERRPLYSAESGGASEPISDRLISAERRALFIARRVDRMAVRYEPAGLRITCEAFVPMDSAPAYSARMPAPGPRTLSATDPAELAGALRSATRRDGFPGVVRVAQTELDRLAAEPAYHCMTRHLLESIRRIAGRAPAWQERARAAGLDDVASFARGLIRLHLLVLRQGAALDRAAEPLAERGIGVVCRDVPPIPG